MKKICVVTGTRAEYGLLYWLMRGVEQDIDLQLQVIVTGMHLSPEFGLTYKEVEKEFKIDKKIEMLLSSDTSIGISKSMGLAQISFAEAYDDIKPDLVVLLGDRYEILSAASAAMIARIPIAHLHGGETTEGAFDEAIRHSITKMAYWHFTAAEEYRNRVIQLGESPNRVFNVGGLGIENIKRLKLLSREEFEESISFKLNMHNLLVTYHSVTLENESAITQFQSLLNVIDTLDDTNIIFTKANSDTDGRIINEMIDDYVENHQSKSTAFVSLGQLRYLSALQYVDMVIGNSSSGISEVPSFKKTTVNIGDRQKGRLNATSIINCKPTEESIQEAFNKAFSEEFRASLPSTVNPYGDGEASLKILPILRRKIETPDLKKTFFDIKM